MLVRKEAAGMPGRFRDSPGLLRAIVLSLAAALVAQLSASLGISVDWGIALIYGSAMALSMRWPIVMAGTGARVVLMTGVLMEALWHHGFATALLVLLVEFAVRMIALYQGGYYWEWYRPVLVLGAFGAAYGLQVVVAGSSLLQPHGLALHLDAPNFVMVFAFWTLLNAGWTYLKAARRRRSRIQELARCLRQTWWVPLSFLAVAWPLEWVHRSGYPLEILICIGLVWLQSVVGPVFTTISQDLALSGLVRTTMPQDAAQRATSHQVIRMAHAIGREVGLSAHEMRLLGYAALLQNYPPNSYSGAPLWLPAPLTPDQSELARHSVDTAVRLVETDGALQEVADVIRLRYASQDGRGYPGVVGEAVPLAAQVLGAANAIVFLANQEGVSAPDAGRAAAEWAKVHAEGHFSRRMLAAMSQVSVDMDPVVDVERGLPEAVRQLQGLVGEADRPSPLLVGIRRIWWQVRGHNGIAPDLPAEVQAVARMATYFASSTQTAEICQITVDAVGQLLGAKVMVAIRNGEAVELSLTLKAGHGLHVLNPRGRTLELTAGALTRALLDQAPMQMGDLREVRHPLAQEFSAVEGVRSALFVPLVHRGRTVGLLLVGLTRHHWFTPREVGLIHLMAGQAAAALENARLIAEAAERLEHISKLNTFTNTLLDNLSAKILVVDPEGRLVLANAAARERFGSEYSLLIGYPLPPELAALAQVDRALAGDVLPDEDVPWGSGTLEMQSLPLTDRQGVLLGAICVARDVTAVRAMEQQVRRVEKLAAIGELAAGAAHEIRNPLTAIRGFMQLLQARAARSDGEYFQIILNEIDRIDSIIRDMLLLARPAEVVRLETDLPALFHEILLMHQSDLQRQNIQVSQQYAPGAATVAVDPKMFRQLLLNLVINATQAMPYGGTLSISLCAADGSAVALTVSDTGVGISPDNLKRLFVPFFTTKEEGTGLGLALCYSIVQAHGGRIDVASQVGQGTSFTITLPLHKTSAAVCH
jgi:signal transduction histidine kinase